MKLLVLLAWVVYVHFFLRIFFSDFRIGNFFITLILFGVLLVLLIYWSIRVLTTPKASRRSESSGSSSSDQPDPARQAASAAQAPAYHYLTFRVAGTSFKNSDGSSRQTILRHLKFGDSPWADDPDRLTVTIDETSFDGQLALAVSVNGYQIGFVPKKDIATVEEVWQSSEKFRIVDVKIIGGGKTDDGDPLSYGCEITLRY